MKGSLSTCAAPAVTTPRLAPPAGAVDVHTHVFGPFGRFPPHQPSVYALPEASFDVHAGMRRTLGIARGVLTQPAPHGDDPSAMLDAIRQGDGALRGIAVAAPEVSDATLAEWKRGGIVGLRFVEKRGPNGQPYPGSVGFDAFVVMAPRLRAHGLHAQLWADAVQYVEWLPILLRLGIPLVLDHFASPDLAQGVRGPAFRAVLDAFAGADLWVKLTVCRCFEAAPGYQRVRPFHDALLATAPDRLLWGSDWPYVRIDPAPDAAHMLDLFVRWTADAALREAILVDNPARLYGFPREGDV